MTAGLDSLRHDKIYAGLGRQLRLGQARDGDANSDAALSRS
jgi:hypothetical protein